MVFVLIAEVGFTIGEYTPYLVKEIKRDRGDYSFLRLVSQFLPESYIKSLDLLVQRGFYPNRAEAIRLAVRDMLQKEKVWNKKDRGG